MRVPHRHGWKARLASVAALVVGMGTLIFGCNAPPAPPTDGRAGEGAEGKESPVIFEGHTRGVISVAFSSDGKRILSASRDGTAKVWDVATGKETLSIKAEGIGSVAFSPDGKEIVAGSGNGTAGTVKVWDATTGREILSVPLKGQTGIITSVAFSPDGKQIASGSWDNTVKVWEVATGKEVLSLEEKTTTLSFIRVPMANGSPAAA